jgi:hypothetical protein
MSVLVRFGTRKAILRWGEWWSADRDLETTLNEATSRWIRETGGPALREPDQERAVATEMAARFDGHVGLHVRTRSDKSTKRFFQQRQMLLEFPSYSPANSRSRRGGHHPVRSSGLPGA